MQKKCCTIHTISDYMAMLVINSASFQCFPVNAYSNFGKLCINPKLAYFDQLGPYLIINWSFGRSWTNQVAVRCVLNVGADNKGLSEYVENFSFFSDLLCFMHKLFPQDTVDWSTNEFLQTDICLSNMVIL